MSKKLKAKVISFMSENDDDATCRINSKLEEFDFIPIKIKSSVTPLEGRTQGFLYNIIFFYNA